MMIKITISCSRNLVSLVLNLFNCLAPRVACAIGFNSIVCLCTPRSQQLCWNIRQWRYGNNTQAVNKPDILSDTGIIYCYRQSFKESAKDRSWETNQRETEMLLRSLLANPALAARLCFQTQSMHVDEAKLAATEHCTHVVTLLQASIVLYLSLWAFESLNLLPDWKAWQKALEGFLCQPHSGKERRDRDGEELKQ